MKPSIWLVLVLSFSVIAERATAFCPSYTLSAPNKPFDCAIEAAPGNNPSPAVWNQYIQMAAQGPESWGTSGPPIDFTIKSGCGIFQVPTSVAPTVPCELLQAIAMQESGWIQFCVPTEPQSQIGGASRTIITFDCGYGAFQITYHMYTSSSEPSWNRSRVASEPLYNAATSVYLLSDDWKSTSCVGDRQPQIVEDWYSATWKYGPGQMTASNNPNNPNLSPNRGVYDPINSPTEGWAYQEKIWGRMEHPKSTEYWSAILPAYPDLLDIPWSGYNTPPGIPEPHCASPTSCVNRRQVHTSTCLHVPIAQEPLSLSQLAAHGESLPIGTVTNAGTVILRGIPSSSQDKQVRLEFEVRLTAEAFRGQANFSSRLGNSGNNVSKCITNLPDGSYHWQARTMDEYGHVSQWVPYGGNNESGADFVVQVTVCTLCSASGFGGTTRALDTGLSCDVPISVSLTPSTAIGGSPINGVDLTASVAGSETGPINYTFYCNRGDAGTDITSGWNARYTAVTQASKTAFGLCDYPVPGVYTAKVIVERGSSAAESRTTITVNQSPLRAPLVTTNAASSVTQSSASLNMSVSPNGSSTAAWFEWGTTSSFGSQTTQEGVGSGATSVPISSTLNSLQCGTTYYFRARAQNDSGVAAGNVFSFATTNCGGGGTQTNELIANGGFEQGSANWTILPGDWHVGPPNPVTPHSGTHSIFLSTAAGSLGNNLTGRFYTPSISVPANAISGQYSFWLNIITTEPSSAAGVDLLHFTVVDASTFTPLVSSWISNQNNTGGSYTFVPFLMDSSLPGRSVRLVFDGTTNATNPTLFALDDISFTVKVPVGGAPSVSTQASDQVTSSSARLNMTVNQNGADSEVWFNLEAGNSSPSAETTHVPIGIGQQNVNFSFGVFDLQCDTLYYFRANASNSYGSRQGAVTSFRTSACPAQAPAARTNPADSITATSARLLGAVNPNGFSTTAWFAWGTDTVLGSTTSSQGVGASNSSTDISATLSNLQCGTTYYYRAKAQNAGGSGSGALYNLTTSSCGPPPNIPPTISVTSPNVGGATADQSFTVAWNDSDPDNNAAITLFYSLHNDCSSPVQIVGNISEDDPANAYAWDTSALPVDGYYILATISDGVNPAVSSCSSGHVSVSHATLPNPIFKDDFEAGDLSAWIFTPPSSTIIYQLTQGQAGQPGKDIWTTSFYSYTGAGGGPGGGLDDEKLLTGGWGDLYYSLLEFNLAGLPSHAASVRLELFSVDSRDVPTTGLYLDRITEPWDWRTQGTGSDRLRLWWADKPATVPWRTAPLPAPTVGQWYPIDVTDLYNGWQDGSIPNYGLELRPVSNNNMWSEFSSSNCADPAFKPRLIIQVTHPLLGVWQGTMAGYASTLTIAQNSSGQFSAQASIDQAPQPVETLTIISVTNTTFDATRPADHNGELRLSLSQTGGAQCLTGDYLDGGTSRPVSLCKTQ